MKKRVLSLTMLLFICVTLVACKETKPDPTEPVGPSTPTTGVTKPSDDLGAPSEGPLVISSQEVDTVFNPFFASSAPDSNVVGYTQMGMLTNDKQGEVVYGENQPVAVLDYEETYDDASDTTTYKFVLKNNLKFSNGSPLTIKDVLFNLYVYLDPAYYGSSTIYSTDIVGLKEYRTQQADENAQDRFMEQFQLKASERIDELAIAAADIIDIYGDASISMEEFEAELANYGDEVLHDFKKACELFDEELNTDFKNAKGTAESIIFKDINGTVIEGLLTTDVEAFLYNEGYLTFNRKTGKLESSLVTDVNELKAWTEEAAINAIKIDMLPKKIEEIIYYWATAAELYNFLVNDALDQYNKEHTERPFPNISGIKYANMDASVVVNGKTYEVPTLNEDGSVASGNQVLSITINEVDPKAIWNFSFGIAPMYYYSDAEHIAKFDYVQNFGVEYSSFSFLNDVVNAPEKNGVPVGAGAYQVADSAGNTTNVSEKDFHKNGVLYFVANKHYIMGEPRIKKLNLKVVPSNLLVGSLRNNETDFIQPNAVTELIQELKKIKDVTVVDHVRTSGYGYIGVNAGKVPDMAVRQAIMHAIDTKETAKFYDDKATPIYRSMSLANWAYPEGATAYYPYIKGPVPENLEVVNPAYKEFVEAKGYKAGQILEEKHQQEFLRGLVEGAGYTVGGNGVYVKGNHSLKYTFTVAGNETEHPAFNPFLTAANILNAIDFEITVSPDNNALQKLTSGELAVWAAAWSSTIDPDMYQVYHMDSKASSTKNWGYQQILQNTGGKYDAEKALVEELSDIIEKARKTTDTNKREVFYSQALDLVMQLAVELPTYQRNDLFAYNSAKINPQTLVSNDNLSPYNGLLSEIWKVNLNQNQ